MALTDIECEMRTIPMQLIQLPAMIGPAALVGDDLLALFMRSMFSGSEPLDLNEPVVPVTLRWGR